MTTEGKDWQLQALEKSKKGLASNELQGDIDELVLSILDGAERIQQIMQNLRVFVRLDENLPKKVDIHENIEAILSLLQAQTEQGIQVKIDFDDKLPEVYCLIQEVNQALMHVIKNAIEAVGSSGAIEIQTGLDTSSDYIVITVRDNGCGIAEKDLGRIFDPFYTTKAIGSGTGLGLTVCQSIIESHQGTLTVISELAKGTEVVIRLPVHYQAQGRASV